jgi:hypothetical protein
MNGKIIDHKQSRDEYTLLSYGTANKTAKKLNQAFKTCVYNFKNKTFHNTNAKPAPASLTSSSSTPNAGSLMAAPWHSPPRLAVKRTKMKGKMPIWTSAGIAAKKVGVC